MTDVLVFNGSVSNAPCVVDFGNGQSPTTQTVGRLRFINNIQINLQGPSNSNDASLLVVGGGTASASNDDLYIEAGSTLVLSANSNSTNRYLEVQVASGFKALVAGTLTFNNANTTPRLVGSAANAISFTSTGVCNMTNGVGSPFGTTGANTLVATGFSDVAAAGSVAFASGARFNQLGGSGSSPFGPGTTAVASFEPGSNYVYTAGTLSPPAAPTAT